MGIFCSIFRPVSLVRPLEPLLGFRPEKRASKFSDSFSTVDMELSCDSHVFHISSHSFEEADMAGHSQTVESCVHTNCCFYLYIYRYMSYYICVHLQDVKIMSFRISVHVYFVCSRGPGIHWSVERTCSCRFASLLMVQVLLHSYLVTNGDQK